MKNNKKKDLVEVSVYAITALFVIYLIYLCFIAKPNQIVFGNVFIDTKSIDFGGFGSLLAGVFSPLAFLWLFLNFRQQDKSIKIAEKQLHLLIIDRENRIKALRAGFKCVNRGWIGGKNRTLQFLHFTFKSNTELRNCSAYINNPDSYFRLLEGNSGEHIRLSQVPKFIEMDKTIEVKIKIDTKNMNKNNNLEDVITINYLDIEGNSHVNEVKIGLFYSGFPNKFTFYSVV